MLGQWPIRGKTSKTREVGNQREREREGEGMKKKLSRKLDNNSELCLSKEKKINIMKGRKNKRRGGNKMMNERGIS